MRFVSTKLTHEYYNIMGWLPEDLANHIAESWSRLSNEVELDQEVVVESPPALVAELQLVSGEGRYISLWVSLKDAIAAAKRLAVAFDREVIYRIGGREVARFDVQYGRAVLKPRLQHHSIH